MRNVLRGGGVGGENRGRRTGERRTGRASYDASSCRCASSGQAYISASGLAGLNAVCLLAIAFITTNKLWQETARAKVVGGGDGGVRQPSLSCKSV
jgi:hypothetical protein